MDALDQAVEEYHAAVLEFVRGHPEPAIRVFSEQEDVMLCNPFWPFAHGPKEVADAIERGASHFADGELTYETLSMFATPELAFSVDLERFRATIDGSEGSGALRVTTVFRLEEDGWKVAHRHADPITTPQAIGSILQQ